MRYDFAWSFVGLTCIAKGIRKEEAMRYIEKAGDQMGYIEATASLRALLHRSYFEGCRSIAAFITKVKRDTDGMESKEIFRFLYENVGTIAIRFVWLLIKSKELGTDERKDNR